MSDEKVAKPKCYGTCNGSARVYAIEARITSGEPTVLNGVLLTRDWRNVPLKTLSDGQLAVMSGKDAVWLPMVPAYRFPTPHAYDLGLIEKNQAALLAQRFQMGPDGFVAARVETRLVEVELTYSYSTQEVGVSEPVSLSEAVRQMKCASSAERTGAV